MTDRWHHSNHNITKIKSSSSHFAITMRFSIVTHSLAALLLSCLLLLQASLLVTGCRNEFEDCRKSSQCCDILTCAELNEDDPMDDTKSCLSAKSIELQRLPREKKLAMLIDFYANKVPEGKRRSAEEVEEVFERNEKYFAKLAMVVERAFPAASVTVERSEL